MFKSAKKRAQRGAKDKVEFKLEFHASRVPQQGWDTAFISLISLETGKVVAKCTKANVRNGTCQWADVICESTRFPSSSADKAPYKIVISSGIARLGLLGETTIDLFEHCATITPSTLSSPLQNCNSGSILHIKIQCLTPKVSLRDSIEQKEACPESTNSHKSAEVDLDVGKTKEADDGVQFPPVEKLLSFGSPTKADSDSPEIPSTPAISDAGLSSRGLLSGDPVSPSTSTSSFSGKHDFSSSSIDFGGLTNNQNFSGSSSSSSITHQGLSAPETSHERTDSSSIASEVAIEETMSWEQRAVKMGIEMEELKCNLSAEVTHSSDIAAQLSAVTVERDQLESENRHLRSMTEASAERHSSDVATELSAVVAERDRLELENRHLRSMMEASAERHSSDIATELSAVAAERDQLESENRHLKLMMEASAERHSSDIATGLSAVAVERDQLESENRHLRSMMGASAERGLGDGRGEDVRGEMKELRDELGYEKSENAGLRLQLQKMQESNSELLLEIQDLGESLRERDRELNDLMFATSESGLVKRDLEHEGESKEFKHSDEEEIASLREEVKALQEEIQEREKETSLLASQKGQLKVLRDKASKLTQDYENASRRAEYLEAANRSLKQETLVAISTLEQKLKAAEERASSAAQSNEDLLKTISVIESDNSNLNQQITALVDQVKIAETNISDLDCSGKKLRETLQQTELAVRERETKVANLLEELASSRAHVKEMEDRLLKSETYREELENQIQDSVDENKIHLSCIENFKSQISEFTGMMETLEKIIEALQVENDELSKKLESATRGNALLKKETDALLTEIKVLKGNAARTEQNYENLRSSFDSIKMEKYDCEDGLERISFENSNPSEESPKEKVPSGDGTIGKPKQPKAVLEDKTPLQTKGGRKSVDVSENKNELVKLRKQTTELRRKLSEQEEENESLKKRLFCLEEELHQKLGSLSGSEKKLKERDEISRMNVSVVTKSLTKGSSKVGSLSSGAVTREAKELLDLRAKVKLLEDEIKVKANELEVSKQKFKEKEAELISKMEHLKVSIEEIKGEHANSSNDKLQKELNRLQIQNTSLFQRENELLSQLGSQEMLQKEIEKLKEEKRELDINLRKLNFERMATLETELAEALEANNMYKLQLKSAFAEQQNVHMAALESLGDVDRVIQDLTELKRRNKRLEEELREMQERYFNTSLKFAEVEAQREELVMTVKNFRSNSSSTRKLFTRSMPNFR